VDQARCTLLFCDDGFIPPQDACILYVVFSKQEFRATADV
jgi:hypothetical protein